MTRGTAIRQATIGSAAAAVTAVALMVPATRVPTETAGQAAPARPGGTDVGTAAPRTGTARCRCGHDAALHEHYRAGTDCATCGCGRFRAEKRGGLRGRLRALRARVRRAG